MRRTLVATALAASLVNPFWAFLTSAWSGMTAKEGAGWDPFGLSAPAPPPPSDAGGGWDPWGLNTPAPSTPSDAGGGWDPFG